MFKGYKVTKKLQDYIEFAKNRYDKLNEDGNVDLWEVLSSYEIIMNQAKCVQHYIHDLIMENDKYRDSYRVFCGINGGLYVRKVSKNKIPQL